MIIYSDILNQQKIRYIRQDSDVTCGAFGKS